MAAPKRSPLTAPTITPPCLNRQHSHTSKSESSKSSPTDASTSLANVASRTASPRRSSAGSSTQSPTSSPLERRVSWEECTKQRGSTSYVSFPDFDMLRAEKEQYDVQQAT